MVRGALTAAVQVSTSIAMVAVGLPVVLHALGAERYGIFALLTVISTFGTIVTAGLQGALVRFVGAAQERNEANVVVVSNIILSGVIGLTIGLIGILGEDLVLMNLFNLKGSVESGTRILYRMSLISSFLLTSGQTFVGLLDVQQKNYVSNICQVVFTVTYWLFCASAAALWHSLGAIGYAVAASAAVWYVLVVGAAIRNWGRLVFSGAWPSLTRTVKNQALYGGTLLFANQLGFLYEPFTKVLIAHTMGFSEVGVFDIALRVKNQIWSFFARMIYPVSPIMAILHDRERLSFLVADFSSKLVYAVAAPAVVIGLSIGPGLGLWLGNAETSLVMATATITTAHMFSLVALPMYYFLIVQGFAAKTVVAQTLTVIANFVTFFALLGPLGFFAAPLANSVAALVSTSYVFYLQKVEFGRLPLRSMSAGVTLLAIVGVGTLLGIAILWLTKGELAEVVLVIGGVSAVFVLLYRYLNVLSSGDLLRYTDSDSAFQRFLVKVLCRN